MSQSLSKIMVHSIFSTKHREHTIDASIEHRLHDYLGGICTRLECPPIQIGGYTNHVHVLTLLSKKISVMDFMQELKTVSNRWMKQQGYSNFNWQNGYAIFSIDSHDHQRVIEYIRNQQEHHSKVVFEDECRVLFKEFGVEYDERYVWD